MGKRHALNLLKGRVKGAKLIAVCDTDCEKTRYFAGKKVFCTADYREVAAKKPDCVIIATEHYKHAEIASYFLEKGIHTLVEKPLTVTVKEGRKLVADSRKSKALFGIMYNQRTNPMYIKAKRLIEGGEIGKIQRVNFTVTHWYRSQAYYNQGGWRASWNGEGGGTLINQCVHQLDILCWLLGRPEKVYAKCKTKGRNITTENDVTALVSYDGFDLVFTASTHELPGTNRLEIAGDKGRIVITGGAMKYDLLRLSEPEVNARTEKGYGRTGYKTRRRFYGIRAVKDALFGQQRNVLQSFTEAACRNDVGLLTARGEEGLNALEIINAMYMSEWTGREISLPFSDEEYAELLAKKCKEERGGQQK